MAVQRDFCHRQEAQRSSSAAPTRRGRSDPTYERPLQRTVRPRAVFWVLVLHLIVELALVVDALLTAKGQEAKSAVPCCLCMRGITDVAIRDCLAKMQAIRR